MVSCGVGCCVALCGMAVVVRGRCLYSWRIVRRGALPYVWCGVCGVCEGVKFVMLCVCVFALVAGMCS